MLFSKNMLDMKRTPKGSLRNQTIFAAILRSLADLSDKLGHELRCNACFAFSCQ